MGAANFNSKDFVHLHLHSDYSLLQSTIQLTPLARQLGEFDMKACALTDLGNMYGAVSFYELMRSNGIHPILGYDAYVATGSRLDKSSTLRSGERPYHNLVLLAKNFKGYLNLVNLASKAFTEGLHHKPRIDKELLAECADGLIALSAGKDGRVGHFLYQQNEAMAMEAAGELLEIFGNENFYLELQHHGTESCDDLVRRTADLSNATGIPMVASNNAYYLNEDDARAHEVLLCIGDGRTLSENGRFTFPSTKYYLRSAEEMWSIFGDEFPQALTNTMSIAEMCQVEIPTGVESMSIPSFKIPADSGCENEDEYLHKVVATGLEERKKSLLNAIKESGNLKYSFNEYEARLKFELDIIKRMRYSGYFLIVWDFIKYAVAEGIPVGPGRGSAAGSLVAYCLGITGIDPLQYDLLFERFLNPERVNMPDIDIDFCIRGRGRVIDHVIQVYGRNSVCQIITFGTLASKAAIKDVGRALGMPYGDVEKIAKMMPPPRRGRNISISQALEEVPELKPAIIADPKVKDLIDLALRIEGCSRHSSVHAAGVVISPRPLHEIVPVAVSPKSEFTSQYSMNDLDKVGMLKMDFLALTTLTIISDCLDTLREKVGVEIDWSSISLSDEKTMELFGEGRTDAVFQFESSGMQEICRRLKPKELEDLSALNALYRPGPIDGGMIEDFIQRHRGDKQVKYLVPEMKEILSNTYGVLVYQEQIMQLAQKLAGYSLGEADMMRRAMGKKKREAMAKEEKKFIEGAIARGINPTKADAIFKLMAQFADYGFNRSHSIAYAYVAFQTAYLKSHYPAYFYAAVLSHESDDSSKVYKYSSELRTMGLQLLPPDVNESGDSFTPSNDSVRFGLNAIKGIGASSVNALLDARKNGRFTSIYDFISRVGQGTFGRRGLESLVAAGAFDSLKPVSMTANEWRARNFASIEAALAYGQKTWNDREVGQGGLFGDSTGLTVGHELADASPWTPTEISRQEKAAIGFYLSVHPLDDHRDVVSALKIRDIAEYEQIKPGDVLKLAGIVSALQVRNSKKGNRFCAFRFEDRSGGVKCLTWAEAYGKFSELLKNDELLIVEGRVESVDGQEITLIVSDVRSLSDTGLRAAKQVSIALPQFGNDPEFLFELFSILDRNFGDCGVILEIPAEKVAVKLRANALRIRGSRAVENDLKAKGCSVNWLI